MSAEGPSAIIDEAWGHIPQSREATAGIGSFTRLRVERIIALVAGVGSLIVFVQAFLTALGQSDEIGSWQTGLLVAGFGPMTLWIVACLSGRWVRPASGFFAITYIITLAVWPLATADATLPATEAPWIWYLVNLATLAAVLAFSLPLQIFWTLLAPLMFGLVRLIQGGFEPDVWYAVAIDVSFALILGGVLLSLGWVLRSIAVGVDEARAQAVDSYARAAAANAAEQERVAVAALMHDSVLAALIAAERADGARARTLAVAMAREALTRLANAENDAREGSDAPRSATGIAEDVEVAARELGVTLSVAREISADAPAVPGRVARALVLAATQAIANAVQHAGGVGLHVTVEATLEQVRLVVKDAGEGFDMAGVPDDRLGIRGSIIARVAAVGGTADLQSGPSGTIVSLEWPASSTAGALIGGEPAEATHAERSGSIEENAS
ncbi:MAG: ATP-binding protein [Microbacterium sp.]